ncbi:MAG: HyaD/HybD family hydrogenase maturation endopeptidase [Desulfobulbaceae bacterium]|nr:HyaD/HybD family hydrogenase maturation endopeptidase [Desulfobulbaceae bacterium]
MNKHALLGIGNTILTDEGVGVHLIHRLQKKYQFDPGMDCIDGGTAGIELAMLLSSYTFLLVVDAVFDRKQQPGTVTVLDQSALLRNPARNRVSPHHLGLRDMLLLAEQLGTLPENLLFVGIVPFRIDWGLELSDELMRELPKAETAIVHQLQLAGITVEPRLIPAEVSSAL